jgi:hypothetical protein
VALGANATGDFQAKIGDDGHFEAFGINAVSTGNFSLEILEIKTKQTLMNGAITQTNGIGNARFPGLFFKPYLIPAMYRLNFRVTDLSGAPNTIWLTMFGRKIFAEFKQLKQVVGKSQSRPLPYAPKTFVDMATPMIPKPIGA